MLTQGHDQEREARRFFRCLYGDEAPGYLTIWGRQDKLTRWVPASDIDQAARVAAELAGSQDVYAGVGLQPRHLGPNRRGEAKDVIAILALWADIDVQGPAHKAGDLPPDKDAALALIEEFVLKPTLIIDSGHGLQPWWAFRKLRIFADDEERKRAQDLVRRFQATLQAKAAAHGWRMDNTSDLARVLRVPGTWNRKLAPVRVRILEVDHYAR